MKAVKYIIFLLLILFIGLAIYVAVQPNSFEVTRTRTMQVPQQLVFENVNDFKNWEAWSSWAEADPDMVITLPDKTSGVDGSYQWEDKDGIGTMRTTATEPFTSINQSMKFAKFPASSIQWNLKAINPENTKVTWTISGKDLPFGFKAFAAFTGDMEKQIGPHFERGLEKLDSILVASMHKYEVTINGVTEYGGGFYLYKTSNATSENISTVMAKHYGNIAQYIAQNQIAMAGMPFTIYHEMNNEEGNVIMSNGMPVNQRVDVDPSIDILCGYQPKMKVLKTTMTGNYNNLQHAWTETMKYLEENNLEQSEENPFEIYTNDPDSFPNPADWRTEIYIPLKE